MKKRIRKILAALLTFTLMFSLVNFTVAAADSDPAVVYDVSTQKFSFENAKVYQHTEEGAHEHPQNVDLFGDRMKNMMPGDEVTQQIQVRVDNLGSSTVTMYLKAENPNADYDALTSDSHVSLEVKSGDDVYTGDLFKGVKLADFEGSLSQKTIDVTLRIDKEASDQEVLGNLTAEVDWVFTVQVTSGGSSGPGEEPKDPPKDPPKDIPEEPVPTDPGKEEPEPEPPTDIEDPIVPLVPQTGDSAFLWLMIASASGIGLILLLMTSPKKKKEEN